VISSVLVIGLFAFPPLVCGALGGLIYRSLRQKRNFKESLIIALSVASVGNYLLTSILGVLASFLLPQLSSFAPGHYVWLAVLAGISNIFAVPLGFGWAVYGIRRLMGTKPPMESVGVWAVGCGLVSIGLVVLIAGTCALLLTGKF
jgi:hypothetical protein